MRGSLELTTASHNNGIVPRVSLGAARAMVRRGPIREPIVVANVVSRRACEAWCDAFLAAKGEAVVTVQVSRKGGATKPGGGTTSIPRTTTTRLSVGAFARGPALASRHEASAFVFDEALLSRGGAAADDDDDDDESDADDDTERLLALPRAAREACFCFEDDPNWFDLFPTAVASRGGRERSFAPAEACVVLAGEGATSTLHVDPFEWLGTSVCFEGSKVWRFMNDEDFDGFAVRRRPSNAFADAPLPSFGTETENDSLFSKRSDAVPRARHLAALFDDDDDEVQSEETSSSTRRRLDALTSLASDASMLAPSRRVPSGFRTAVQLEGDVVLIPPGWPHQTYALEPSLAVASQRCGRRDALSVFAHATEAAGATSRASRVLKRLRDYSLGEDPSSSSSSSRRNGRPRGSLSSRHLDIKPPTVAGPFRIVSRPRRRRLDRASSASYCRPRHRRRPRSFSLTSCATLLDDPSRAVAELLHVVAAGC